VRGARWDIVLRAKLRAGSDRLQLLRNRALPEVPAPVPRRRWSRRVGPNLLPIGTTHVVFTLPAPIAIRLPEQGRDIWLVFDGADETC